MIHDMKVQKIIHYLMKVFNTDKKIANKTNLLGYMVIIVIFNSALIIKENIFSSLCNNFDKTVTNLSLGHYCLVQHEVYRSFCINNNRLMYCLLNNKNLFLLMLSKFIPRLFVGKRNCGWYKALHDIGNASLYFTSSVDCLMFCPSYGETMRL